MSIKEGLTMNAVKMLVVFFLGTIVGAIGLFFFLVFSDGYKEESTAKPAVTTVSLSKETCLDGVVKRARNAYMDLAERRESIALAMEHGTAVSVKKLNDEDSYAQKKHLDISATLDYCLTYGELPAKSDHYTLTGMN